MWASRSKRRIGGENAGIGAKHLFHLLLCEEQVPELVGLADTKQVVMLWIATYLKLTTIDNAS